MTDLFARVADFLVLLCAFQAFAAIGFQSCRESVISLDLTGIIAFDAVREWEGPGVGYDAGFRNAPDGSRVHTGKRSGFA